MKFLIILLLVLSIAYVISGYIMKTRTRNCPIPIINNVPYIRTFTEEQEQPSYVMSLYKDMFWKLAPWNDKNPQKTYLKVGKKQPAAYGGRPKSSLAGKSSNRDDYLNNT
jgi:hypothetical protein